ncbi:hypothetical protein ACEPAI_3331 [Sanghuangporus weigelae]
MSDDHELELRRHVRELLDDYVYTHLTINHVEYSDGLASEALAKILKPISTHGPGEIAFPVDPFQTLKARFEFDSLQPYDEVWNPSSDALGFLKEMYMVPKGKPKTQIVWEEDDEFDIDRISHRPMTPLLSRSSLKKTPCLGNASKGNARKSSLASALSFHGLRQIPNEDLPEENPPKLDDCLDLKLTIDASTHQSMTELQKKTPFLNRLDPRPLPVYAAEYLSNRSPDYQEKFRTISPPLFARDRRERPAKVERDRSIFRPLKLDPLEVQEVGQDYSTESTKVIDGWVTIPGSGSTPSLSSGTSEVDELEQDAEFWKPSSSSDELAAIETLETMKMEEPLFPHSESKKPKQSLAGFITSKLPVESPFRVLTSPKSDDILSKPEHSSPSMVPVSLSVLGQPPSEGEGSVTFPNKSPGDPFYRDLLCVLKGHSAGNKAEVYQDIIMDERLDEKEIMFMDVPKLPPPNGYLHDASTNSARSIGYVISGGNSERPILKLPVNIKKVPGVKSLNHSEPPYDRNEALSTDDDNAALDRIDPISSQQDVIHVSKAGQQDRSCRRDDRSASFPNMPHMPLPLTDSTNQEVIQRPGQDIIQTQKRPDSPDVLKGPRGPSLPSTLLFDHDKLSSFLLLRGRRDLPSVFPSALGPAKLPEKGTAPEEGPSDTSGQDFSLQIHHRAPEDLLVDTRAFVVPEHWKTPITQRTYLVSLDFIQQRRLVRYLEDSCGVRLVERDIITPMPSAAGAGPPEPKGHSADVSLILGPHSAVVFFPLSSLPSQSAYKILLDALAVYSWRFSNMLLVLMAFPRSQLIRATNSTKAANDTPSSYSPPAIKAARRVRRDLAIREGTGEKRTACTIELAFADDAEQVAKLVRAFGDLLLQSSQFDFNAYIGEEEQEGERDLAEVEGMNAFCAVMILRCCTLEEFLQMSSNERAVGLADLIGLERIEHVNTILSKNRMSEMDIELPSPSLVSPIDD